MTAMTVPGRLLLLPLVLAAVTASVVLVAVATMAAAYADTPYRQPAEGIQPEEIRCEYPRIQMESPRGMSICVFDRSVPHLELRGFARDAARAHDDFYTYDSKGVLMYDISEGASAQFVIPNKNPHLTFLVYIAPDSADGLLDLHIPTRYFDARTDGCGGMTGAAFAVLDRKDVPVKYTEGRQTAHVRHITIPFEGYDMFVITGTCVRGTMVVDRNVGTAVPGLEDVASPAAVPYEPRSGPAAQDDYRPSDVPYCIRYPVEPDNPKYDPGRLSDLLRMAPFDGNHIFNVRLELDDQSFEDFGDMFFRCYAHHYHHYACTQDDYCVSNMSVRDILALGNYPEVIRVYVDYDYINTNQTYAEPDTLLDVRYVFRDYPGKSWVYLEPIQCSNNPYSSHVVSESFEQLRAYEQLAGYYMREHGVAVHDAVHMWGLFDIRGVCSTKDGSRLYLLVDDQSLETMTGLGFRTFDMGFDIYGQ